MKSATTAPAKLTDAEIQYLNKSEICRLATASKDGQPHVVPVSHLYRSGFVYIAVDYGTKKLKNLRENPQAALVVDTFRPVRAVMVQGTVKIIERGEEYRDVYKEFHSKFEWVRRDPWKEGEAPFVKMTPTHKVSWGFRKK
jgi:nitroimidazol reductase NimA-like FMN-containing flavoprotein (pyridoxamine 5'-phosphate oxidase superfamily)